MDLDMLKLEMSTTLLDDLRAMTIGAAERRGEKRPTIERLDLQCSLGSELEASGQWQAPATSAHVECVLPERFVERVHVHDLEFVVDYKVTVDATEPAETRVAAVLSWTADEDTPTATLAVRYLELTKQEDGTFDWWIPDSPQAQAELAARLEADVA